MVIDEKIYEELNSMKKELSELKTILMKITQYTQPKKIVTLKGLLSGISISSQDIKDAKKSLFKNAGI